MNEKQAENVRIFLRDKILATRSQSEVARITKLTQSTLSEVLHAKRPPTLNITMELSRISGVPIDTILNDPGAIAKWHHLGETPGYTEAEKALRSSKVIVLDAEVWLNIRDISLPKPLKRIDSHILYLLVTAVTQGWDESWVSVE